MNFFPCSDVAFVFPFECELSAPVLCPLTLRFLCLSSWAALAHYRAKITDGPHGWACLLQKILQGCCLPFGEVIFLVILQSGQIQLTFPFLFPLSLLSWNCLPSPECEKYKGTGLWMMEFGAHWQLGMEWGVRRGCPPGPSQTLWFMPLGIFRNPGPLSNTHHRAPSALLQT